MVLVPVRQQDAADLLFIFFEVGDVRDNEINAEHILIGECDAAVHHDDVVAVLDHGHVLADLMQTAERGDADLAGRLCATLAALALRRLRGLCDLRRNHDRSGRGGLYRLCLRLLRSSCVVPLGGFLLRRGGTLRMLRGVILRGVFLIVFFHKFSFVSVLKTYTPREKRARARK